VPPPWAALDVAAVLEAVVVVAGVVVTGVVVAGVVLAGVVVAGVVLAGVVVDPEPAVPLEPVEPVEPAAGVVGPRWSRVLSVVGLSVGVVAGTLSATFVPPQAASATPHSVAAINAVGRARRPLTSRAAACAGRMWGSR
jgi:hypothetical protein